MTKICVMGLGYIGLPTAAMFANHGFEVVGVDVNRKVVDALNNGEIIIEEPGLQGFVKTAIDRGSLRGALVPEKADAFIIAVPTPITADRKADLSYVVSATESILPYLSKYNTVIVESTIPPRTITDIVAPLIEKAGFNVGEDLFLAHCPERVLPGQILIELVHNNRIVGGISELSSKKAMELYRSFVKGEIYQTDATSAEMAKLMENTYRDINIALANELTQISERLGINALEVIQMANKHPRVQIHSPGPGVGGHCIAVDPYFIIEKAPEEARLISLSREINSSMPHFVVDQIHKLSKGPIRKVAILGITYKGNIDDVRESPALEVMDLLRQAGYELSVYDPYVVNPEYNLCSSLKQSLKGADCAVILADHNEFKHFDYDQAAEVMQVPLLLDTKNCVEDIYNRMFVYKLGDYGR